MASIHLQYLLIMLCLLQSVPPLSSIFQSRIAVWVPITFGPWMGLALLFHISKEIDFGENYLLCIGYLGKGHLGTFHNNQDIPFCHNQFGVCTG
jgi:hypothetical protein